MITELRVRSKLSDEAMQNRAGKLLGDEDYDVLLTGAVRITKMDGRPLCVFLPGAVAKQMNADGVYEVLHELRKLISRNRGMASGTQRFRSAQTRSYTRPIPSGVVGAIESSGQQKYCRLTAWTGRNLPRWDLLSGLLQAVAGHLQDQVPERYAAQLAEAKRTDPAWVVNGTPFSTITVNNSYATGTHTDKGDLDAGFSTIAVSRTGTYTGGKLVFPQYRLAVDMQHGDLILMDAHEWHGNTQLLCACGVKMNGLCKLCDAERISVVSYFRTKLVDCGSPEQEMTKATNYKERAEIAAARRFAGG